MNKMKQAHFFSIPTQGNLYTIKSLHLANDTNKLLIATLKRQVFCFEYVENSAGILIPTAKEISFTYIPSGAEIISIDAFNKSEDKNDFIIGITIIKTSNDNSGLETYLNIYSEWEESQEFNIESIAQNCLTLELNFIPYHLSHTFLVSWKNEKIINKEIIFILTGSDNQIHIFQENEVNHSYKEIDRNELFPEFYTPPSVVIWVDVYYYNNYSERVSAIGCECGYVRLVRVCCKTNKIIFNTSTRFISPISQIKIYPAERSIKKPGFMSNGENEAKIQVVSPENVFPEIDKDECNEENIEESAIREGSNISVTTGANIVNFESKIDEEYEKELEDSENLVETIIGDSSAIQNKITVCYNDDIEVPNDQNICQKGDIEKVNLEFTEGEAKLSNIAEVQEYLEEANNNPSSVLPTSIIESSDILEDEETESKSSESSPANTLVESSDTLKEEERSSENSLANVLMESSDTSKEEDEEIGEKSTHKLVESSQDISEDCFDESNLQKKNDPQTSIDTTNKICKDVTQNEKGLQETRTTNLRNIQYSNPQKLLKHEQEVHQEHVNKILNLLVVNAVLPSVFFNDIANKGLGVYTTLKRTETVSVSACIEVADVDFDGTDEILLGSSGEDVKLYVIENGIAKLKEIKRIVSPIFNIQYLDITGDGVKELIIFTMKGVYILQHEAEEVQRILKEKIEKLTIPDI